MCLSTESHSCRIGRGTRRRYVGGRRLDNAKARSSGPWRVGFASGVYHGPPPRVSGHASLDTAVGEAESPTWQTSPVPAISKKPPGSMKFPLNQSVDVLRLIDIARDGVVGNWTAKGTELAVASGTGTRIVVPVVVDGGYDFDAEFTRTMGTDSINFILPVGSHACMAVLGGWKGGASGLMDVDGRDAMNPGNPIAVRPGPIETGHRYRASVRVRILSKDQGKHGRMA